MKQIIKYVFIGFLALMLVGGALVGGWILGGQHTQVITASSSTSNSDNDQFIQPGYGSGIGSGMMGNQRNRGDHQGMMPGRGALVATTPLTIDQADQVAQKYLDSLNVKNLKIAEVIIFDNGAYVRVVEKSAGIGAFELLVDPVTQEIQPEHGANMMWNLKYRGLIHSDMMDNWAGNSTAADVSSDMKVTPDQALQYAQDYLDQKLQGTTTSEDIDAFYGYYTIDVMKDGHILGMLSVNGSTGQVFYHIWHGTFIEMKEYK
jgi:hypothetical protein